MKKTSISVPASHTISHNRLRQRIVTLNIDVEKTDEGYSYTEVELRPGTVCYDGIVSQLVTHKYPSDRMQAIINNYLVNPSDETVLEEFTAMQEWRAMSKSIAKKILSELTPSVL